MQLTNKVQLEHEGDAPIIHSNAHWSAIFYLFF